MGEFDETENDTENVHRFYDDGFVVTSDGIYADWKYGT